ncbi:MAG: hypothetical protein U0939_25690 [Pirellulales bacterium]
MNSELRRVLADLVVDPQIAEATRRRIVEALFAELRSEAAGAAARVAGAAVEQAGVSEVSAAAAASAAPRRLVYVHGICRHDEGFSNAWWEAMKGHVGDVYGAGTLKQERLEVIWSDLVNEASDMLVGALADAVPPATASASESLRKQAASEILGALRDRVDQLDAPVEFIGSSDAPTGDPTVVGALSIPGFNCIDDFAIYLTSDSVREKILKRFTEVVRPLLASGVQVDVISHSWGTVVAYEGLRELASTSPSTPLVRNFFTVGSALSIGPVKARLRPANRDGGKPANTRRWINLDARGDVVGGALQGRPFAVDEEHLQLAPVGCAGLGFLVNPQCAHGSYFRPANVAVNRDIFARNILS